MKEVWKKYDEVELTHSSVHHLMAMHDLLERNGYVRGVDIAKHLDISRSSVSITLRKLVNRGYVLEDENKFYQLSEKGKALIDGVLYKRKIIKIFFEHALQLSPKIAEEEACKIEHLLEEETGERLMTFMGFFLSSQKIPKNFRDAFKSFRFECKQVENCDLCDQKCYFAQGKHELIATSKHH